VITPRITRLWRAPDLRGFQRTILDLVPADPFAARACAVLVPTRGAAAELRRTFENVLLHEGARVLPELVTRDEFYGRLARRAPALLTPFDREVLLRRCGAEAAADGFEPPFNVRPGLVAEILRFYDELRRHRRTVADFERLAVSTLEPGAGYDRGAARLLQQTKFLVSAFTRFEAAIAAIDRADEHRVRAAALDAGADGIVHVIVTVADQAADRHGLWASDFDLLSRVPGLAQLDVVATDALLDSGFLERIHDLLPGIEEHRTSGPATPPTLLVPPSPGGAAASRAFVLRDREEELAALARTWKRTRGVPLDRTAVVFQRPLPYLYLARQVFDDARMPWQALDALPLAAEPFPAAVDLLFSAVAADFTRGALVDLLRSPHCRFEAGGQRLSLAEVAACDAYLAERKYLGSAQRLAELAAEGPPAVRAAAAAAGELDRALGSTSASAQIDAVLRFIEAHECWPDQQSPAYARHQRARTAVLSAMHMLRDAHRTHDDRALTIAELSGAVRRWIGGQTFSPRLGAGGLNLLEARAAAYADLDEIRIVGLTEADWPERTERNIFYPPSLLAQLGWPNEQDRVRAARVRFQDLLRLPARHVSLSTISLEDDGLVTPSSLLDDVDACGLAVEPAEAASLHRVFVHEALWRDPVIPAALDGEASEWLRVRMMRGRDGERFRGSIGPRAPGVYAISRVETYLSCPFRYFAREILRLPEERSEDSWMSPQERGVFVHDVFEAFFSAWQRDGRGAISTANVNDALALFRQIAEERLERLPESDRALERTLLLGSAAAAGLAERAFSVEIDQGVDVIERLLEYELRGTFSFAAGGEVRPVAIRAKADRIDLLEDGTLRVIDYKLGRAPARRRALQLAVYGASAEQALEGRHGRSWRVSRAGYVAFKEKSAFSELARDLQDALADGQARLVGAVDAIEAGEFPVNPDEPYLCTWCPYASVCRKDYVGDE
jgi:RecB family exonuclease